MHKAFAIIGTLLAAISVVLGAFGAHALKAVLSAEQLVSWETAVRYQMYHALALILVSVVYHFLPYSGVKTAGWLLFTGTLLFSGSIYVLIAMKSSGAVGIKGLGMITPIGGVLLIIGWLTLLFQFITKLKCK